MISTSSCGILVALLFVSTIWASPQQKPPSATINQGVVIGTATAISSSTVTVNKFLGIPFASPPERFAPPVPPKPWKKPLNTFKNKPACIQEFGGPENIRELLQIFANTPPPEAGESEDCLFVNVWAPASPPPKEGRTVMFWIYGGNLQFGSNSYPYYDGTVLAANQDVVVVAPNYRTNVFGFPMSPQLPLSERNLGFLDQRLALNWTVNNIHAFGGDPKKITIFGQSAGGSSVDELITTTPHNPPFRAAIMQSGQTSLYVNQNNSNTQSWDALVEILNCSSADDVLECARSANASTIKNIVEQTPLYFTPVSDNVTQLEFPEAARVAKKIAQVPILLGTTADEGTFFAFGQTNTTAFLSEIFPASPMFWSVIEKAYPLGSSPQLASQYLVNSAIAGDFEFQCPCAIVANDSKTIGIPTWRYLYNATFTNTLFKQFPDLGVYHGAELPMIFGTFPEANATKAELQLGREMQKAWADFAKHPMAGPGWKAYPNVNVWETSSREKIVNATSLDTRCSVYQEVYEALGIIASKVPKL